MFLTGIWIFCVALNYGEQEGTSNGVPVRSVSVAALKTGTGGRFCFFVLIRKITVYMFECNGRANQSKGAEHITYSYMITFEAMKAKLLVFQWFAGKDLFKTYRLCGRVLNIK